jgi:hypothetical protein
VTERRLLGDRASDRAVLVVLEAACSARKKLVHRYKSDVAKERAAVALKPAGRPRRGAKKLPLKEQTTC